MAITQRLNAHILVNPNRPRRWGIVVDLEEKLRSMLSEEQKALFKQYDDAVADLTSVSNADCFVEGYQLGVNLILAAFRSMWRN